MPTASCCRTTWATASAGCRFPPRWGLVTPEEIERVDVMYGPFSAAYPGNSVGAVVDYVTRMPTNFEAHAKVGYVVAALRAVRHRRHLPRLAGAARRWATASGDWSLVAQRQPHRQRRPAADLRHPPGQRGHGRARRHAGDGRRARSQQRRPAVVPPGHRHAVPHRPGPPEGQAGLRLHARRCARATCSALWQNDARRQVRSLSARCGRPAGLRRHHQHRRRAATRADAAATSPLTREKLHARHARPLGQEPHGGEWDWEAAASLYDYARTTSARTPRRTRCPARDGGAGTLADGSGTGWNTLALQGHLAPARAGGAHVVDFGLQQERYTLRYLTSTSPATTSTTARRAREQRGGRHAPAEPVGAGRLALRAALEGRAGPARRALGGARRPHATSRREQSA